MGYLLYSVKPLFNPSPLQGSSKFSINLLKDLVKFLKIYSSYYKIPQLSFYITKYYRCFCLSIQNSFSSFFLLNGSACLQNGTENAKCLVSQPPLQLRMLHKSFSSQREMWRSSSKKSLGKTMVSNNKRGCEEVLLTVTLLILDTILWRNDV